MTFQIQSKINESEKHVSQFREKRLEVLEKLKSFDQSREITRLVALAETLPGSSDHELSLPGIPGKIELSLKYRSPDSAYSTSNFKLDPPIRELQGSTAPMQWLDKMVELLSESAEEGGSLQGGGGQGPLSPIEALERIDEAVTKEVVELAERVHTAAERLTKRLQNKNQGSS